MEANSSSQFIGYMEKQSFRARFVASLDETGISIAELSRRTEVTYDVLNKLKRGDVQSTSAENAAAIARFFKWTDDSRPMRVEPGDEASEEQSLVPVYDVNASAGYGAVVDHEEPTHSLAFPPTYLRKLTSSSPGNLSIIGVKGDSMEPTLLDDDIVLLDQSKKHLGYDGLFVLRFNDTLHVKRVGLSAKKGHVRIISDNKELYDALETPVNEVEVVGKVLWYGRKV